MPWHTGEQSDPARPAVRESSTLFYKLYKFKSYKPFFNKTKQKQIIVLLICDYDGDDMVKKNISVRFAAITSIQHLHHLRRSLSLSTPALA